ncbi:MAG TPA: HAD hydrolase-like protein [Desulfovibrio sp.]|uniref:HAD family hydrolase n=1 Tax=Desulfovibrio sp. TaxID=885 RepID=UPI002D5A9BEA|nr:HAD hydrolase-like protein [Desulfovibrio sp.]HZF60037.1 HAD hydrolase-like protein [Desulfovibrio sp.]
MRAFIFDLDGTLVDSLEDIGQACNDILASHGYPVHPLPAYRFYVGRGFHKLVNDALPEGEAAKLSSDQLAALIAEARARYGENMCVRTKPYAGITEALHTLAADGHALAVLSNKPDDLTVELVRRYFPDVPFTLVRGGREGVPLKPEPDAPLDMLRHMDFLPERSFYVGDSNVDIFTARNAGMISIGVAWGFRGADELRAAQADHVIDSPVALTRLAKEA